MVFFDWIDEFVQRHTDRLFHFLMRRYKAPLSAVRSTFIAYLVTIRLAKANEILDLCVAIAIAVLSGYVFRPALEKWEQQNESQGILNLVEGIPEWSEELNEETNEVERIPTRKRREHAMKLMTGLLWIGLVGNTIELGSHIYELNLHPILMRIFHIFFAMHSVTEQVIIVLLCIAWLFLLYSRYTPYKKSTAKS